MIQPPGRIEQLNNFQDSVQSPDGLDRLRALQYIQEALPSTRAQGLMGMPQVTAQAPQMQPQVPMMNREDGGPVVHAFSARKIGNPLVEKQPIVEEIVPVVQQPIPEDTMKVFARDPEGIRNRAIQGGVLEGQRYTPTGGGTTTASIPTLKGFGSKEEAIAHHNQSGSGGLINVYQLDDGSWDYTRAEESPELMGRPTTPGAPINIAQPNNMLSTGPFINQPSSFGPKVIGMPATPGGPAMAEGGYIQHREGGGQVDPAQAAQGLASLGRYGDNMLVHMNPEEVEGLASLGKVTYNPITGLPEAWGWGSIMKTVRRLAPVALAIAAPYALGAGGLGLIGSNVAGMSAASFAGATALGSFLGNKIAGAKTGDALKAGLFSGALGGLGKGLSTGNWINSAGTNATNASQALGAGPRLVNQATGNVVSSTTPAYAPFTGAPTHSLAGATNAGRMIAQPNLVYKASSLGGVPGGSSTNMIGLAGADNITQAGAAIPVPQDIGSAFQYSNAGLDAPVGTGRMSGIDPSAGIVDRVSTSPLLTNTKEAISNIGSDIYKDYSTTGGVAKLVGMDLMTPDWEAQYAAEAAAKDKQLAAAGYTVDTGFNGQTIIRDSSGVQMPKTLTVQQILDRALGKTPRTKMVADYGYGPSKAEGGLISLAQGGEFSGIVSGDGHGMEDNVYMPIVEKEQGSQVGTLAVSPSEYVVDSYTMAALGNGNADAGAKVMDNVVKGVRKKAYGNMKQPNEINGLSALQPMMGRI